MSRKTASSVSGSSLARRADWARLLNITRAVLPVMRSQRAGHIINMSSLGGYRSAAGFGARCSTKYAAEGLTEALRAELKPTETWKALSQSTDFSA